MIDNWPKNIWLSANTPRQITLTQNCRHTAVKLSPALLLCQICHVAAWNTITSASHWCPNGIRLKSHTSVRATYHCPRLLRSGRRGLSTVSTIRRMRPICRSSVRTEVAVAFRRTIHRRKPHRKQLCDDS